MKNWPGRPGSTSPRSTRSSVYGPTVSLPVTLRSSRRIKGFSSIGSEPALLGEAGLCPAGASTGDGMTGA